MDGLEDVLLAGAGFGGLGDFQEERIAADLEGRRVEPLGLRLAPVPDRVQHAEPGAAQPFAAADPPVVLRRGRETFEAGLDLRAALLLEPVHPAEPLELAGEDVA
jgi:hypothetical protein